MSNMKTVALLNTIKDGLFTVNISVDVLSVALDIAELKDRIDTIDMINHQAMVVEIKQVFKQRPDVTIAKAIEMVVNLYAPAIDKDKVEIIQAPPSLARDLAALLRIKNKRDKVLDLDDIYEDVLKLCMGGNMFALMAGEACVGCVSCETDPNKTLTHLVPSITNGYVDPQYRCQGYGQDLIKAVIDQCASNDTYCTLFALAGDTGFFEKLGFSYLAPIVSKGYTDHFYYMKIDPPKDREVRPPTEDDLPLVIEDSYGWWGVDNGFSKSVVATNVQLWNKKGHLLVLKIKGVYAGCIVFRPQPATTIHPHIMNLYIRPEYRGNRYAGILMQEAEDSLNGYGVTTIRLLSTKEGRFEHYGYDLVRVLSEDETLKINSGNLLYTKRAGGNL